MTRRLQPTPFKAAKNFRRNSALYFSRTLAPPCLAEAWWIVAIHAPFPYYYWALFWDQFWAPVLGAVLGPVLGTTIRIERTGAKTEAKTGSQIWTFAHFFGHAANRCPQWSCPCFVTFAFFLVRAHPCTHSATANSSEARSYWKKNARKREQAQFVPPAKIVAADIQTVHVATNRITCKNLMRRYTGTATKTPLQTPI